MAVIFPAILTNRYGSDETREPGFYSIVGNMTVGFHETGEKMTPPDFHEAATCHFNTNYELLQSFRFVEVRQKPLCDYLEESDRRCRFCGKGKPDTTFKNDAHAVSEFLGNRYLLSLNECDKCNCFFGEGDGYEDHLSKYLGLMRAVMQLPKKRGGAPTFVGKGLRVETNEKNGGLQLHVPSPATAEEFLKNGNPKEIVLHDGTESQPYVPIKAAMALVKFACTICPSELLPECKPAIDWLMGRKQAHFSPFPIFQTTTPGFASDALNGVKLLRRKTNIAAPFLWLVVRFRHVQMQTFVPFCPSDLTWNREDAPSNVELCYYPSEIGPDWPRGASKYSQGDLSGTEPVRTKSKVIFRVTRMDKITHADGRVEILPQPTE